MTTRERTVWLFLGHIQASQQLNPKMPVDHMVHVLPVRGDGGVVTQLAVEDHPVLAEHVSWHTHFPPMPGLDHDMMVSTYSLRSSMIAVNCVASLTTSLILQDNDKLPLNKGYVAIVKVFQ